MPQDTYHDHILATLPAHERELVTDLVGKVETKYHPASTPMDRHKPCAWQKTLELIHKDSLRCVQNEILQLNHRHEIPSDRGTGSTLDRLSMQVEAVTRWCDEVEQGLMTAQAELYPHFNTFWTDKALLYLRNRYKRRVLTTAPEHERVESCSNEAYEMMQEKYPPQVVVAAVKKLIDHLIHAGRVAFFNTGASSKSRGGPDVHRDESRIRAQIASPQLSSAAHLRDTPASKDIRV
ncbi:hypothetical protein RHOSPDRAFT_26853 [Rhodotorula sp. JG-1b]|nr:hypothetical protein RHOSPDRAFT_26853 [Rhodotorula sp. JG-1b]